MPTTPAPPADLFAPADWLALLEVSLTGVLLLRPVPGGPGSAAVADFAIDYLNPAGQRMAGLAERPGGTLLGRFPHALAAGVFEYYRRVFETGEQLTYEVNYQADGLDNYFEFSARRRGERLLVSFTDTATRPRTAVELALRESQARAEAAQRETLYQIFAETPAAICVQRGPAHRYEYVNAAYQAFFPGREFIGRPVAEALPETVGSGVVALLDRVYRTGETYYGYELPLLMAQPQGAPRLIYFTFTYQAYREQGEIVGISTFATDVTEQVLARQREEEGREALKRFQFMADQARDPFLLIREDGTFAYLNPRTLDAWGYTPAEARRLRVPDVDPMYDYRGFADLFARAQRGPVPLFETRHRRKDGHVYPVEMSVAGLVLDDRPHLLAVARDVTEQKRILEALRESEARFRTLADAAPNLVWAVHPDATIRYINRAFVEFVGLGEEEYLAVGWGSYVHPEDFAATQRALDEAIADRTLYRVEHRMRRHDGQYRWLLAQGAPSYYPSGALYGYVGSAIDITDLKQANEQLRRTNADLDNFIYTASHDLKAPIANIEGLLKALDHELPPAGRTGKVPVMLGLMQQSVERFGRTIGHLTDLSRLQQEHGQPASEVNLARVVREVALDLAPLIAQAGAQVEVQVPEDATLTFAEKNLRSVVYNLFSNALKYRSAARVPLVRVSYQRQEHRHVLAVEDNGLGLDLAKGRQKLFGMFQRLHTHVEGTGVGLHMVQRIVENAGGRIEVESQLDRGSVFRVYVPR